MKKEFKFAVGDSVCLKNGGPHSYCVFRSLSGTTIKKTPALPKELYRSVFSVSDISFYPGSNEIITVLCEYQGKRFSIDQDSLVDEYVKHPPLPASKTDKEDFKKVVEENNKRVTVGVISEFVDADLISTSGDSGATQCDIPKQLYDLLGALLSECKKPNVFIGGSQALKMHGMELADEPGDWDIVVYEPTDTQKLIIKSLSVMNVYRVIEPEYFDDEQRSVIGLSFPGGYKVDIIIERSLKIPSGNFLGIFAQCSEEIQIQSVKGVIDAKKKNGRKKDRDQIEKMIELNFK